MPPPLHWQEPCAARAATRCGSQVERQHRRTSWTMQQAACDRAGTRRLRSSSPPSTTSRRSRAATRPAHGHTAGTLASRTFCSSVLTLGSSRCGSSIRRCGRTQRRARSIRRPSHSGWSKKHGCGTRRHSAGPTVLTQAFSSRLTRAGRGSLSSRKTWRRLRRGQRRCWTDSYRLFSRGASLYRS